jgi:hypothetical protein
MVVSPEDIAKTMPVASIEATAVLAQLQEPPPASINDVVNPLHTLVVPVIGPGKGSTITVAVVMHPVDNA